ncbi:hypothetical protein E3N88_44182 [Mikania micrantha]|uniref:RNA polymerase Rpb4/RPC9 core domain-containing protein n=1 Tax=Mikania micrantha TaxID=192012 RepID=A0A5N6LCT5_9ASTR|nr:hypothetical protein E3N88_44182 [Mikania micrantha]
MSDKGGKGGKSALKSPGKDDKLKGRKVQFDSEDMYDEKFETNGNGKSNGKDGNPFSKGIIVEPFVIYFYFLKFCCLNFYTYLFIYQGKGGKGDKGGSAKKEPPPLMLKVEEELPENAKCLMNCEAAQILQGIQDHMVLLSKDPTIKIPSSFDRALQYANTGNFYANPHSVRQILDSLKKQDVSDGEICVIANTGIESTGKAFALMPSLKAKKSQVKEALGTALTELKKLKSVTDSTIVLD